MPKENAMREAAAAARSAGARGTKRVSIKATTSERLGFVGREEGVAAYAVAQVEWD